MHVYETMIKLTMVETAGKGLAAIVAHLVSANRYTADLEKGLSRLKLGAVGVAGAFAGIEALKFASHIEKAGEHLVHVKTMFEAALPAATRMADMTKITSAALKESGDNLRTGLSGNVEAIHDLYNIVGDVGEATKLLPTFNVLKNILDSVADKGSLGDAASNANVAKAVRAFEFMGRADPAHPELLARTMGQYSKTLIGQRGRVTGGDLFTQTQTAGDAAKGWSDLFATTIFPEMILLGGKRVGFGAYQTFNNLWGGGGGNLSSFTQAMGQEKWGLHTKEDEIRDEKGKFKGFKAGSLWDAAKLRENPLEWANAYRALLQTKYGVNIEDMTSMQLVISDIARNNKNMKSYLDELLLPSTNRQLNKGVAVYGRIPDDAAGIINANDPRAWRQALSAQWETLQEVFGEGYVFPFINNVLKPLTETLNAISQWGAANPGYMKIIAEGFVAVGGALVFVGGVTVLASVFGVGGLMAAATLALGALAAINWKGMTANLEAANPSLTALPANVSVLSMALQKVGDAFQWLSDKISATFGWLFHGASPTGGAGLGDPGHVRRMIDESNLHSSRKRLLFGRGGPYNLGNIRVPGTTHSFQHFGSESDAAHAITNLAAAYKGRYGVDTPAGILGHYSPPSENQTALLIKNFQRRTGLGPNQHLDFTNPDTAARFAYGIAVQEGKAGHRTLEDFKHMYLPRQKQSMVIHQKIYLDGKQIATNTVRHMVRSTVHATSVGRQDGRGTFMGPGAEVFA